jgi:quercetin dioxygenase-like cupin family protein
MEIRRFGVGHRRPDGPPGTEGVEGRVIHGDARGAISELAFARRGRMNPHSNPNTTWFLVIEGGGFVQVGEERTRVSAGEAVLWPAGAVHAAWTDLSEMRAIVVELAGPDDAAVRGVLEGGRALLEAGVPAEKGEGELAPRPNAPDDYDRSSGEPF